MSRDAAMAYAGIVARLTDGLLGLLRAHGLTEHELAPIVEMIHGLAAATRAAAYSEIGVDVAARVLWATRDADARIDRTDDDVDLVAARAAAQAARGKE